MKGLAANSPDTCAGQVVHEETARVSTYVVSPSDVAESAENSNSQPGVCVSALAVHPRDANQVLIGYEESAEVFLWDFTKKKVVREYTLSKRSKTPTSSSRTDEEGKALCNSVQSLSWHSSGKRFVAGFKFGGFAVFRIDKSSGYYHNLSTGASDDENESLLPIRHLQWISPPPHSRYAHYAGAIAFTGGRAAALRSLLTIVYPRNGTDSDDAMVDLFKSEELAWEVTSVESFNYAEIASFTVAQDQVDYSSKIAPLSTILLSGNPLDGCLPSVSVQSLPCFIKFRSNDQEEWEWQPHHLVPAMAIPPLLQFSPLKTFSLINVEHADGSVEEDLLSAWEQNESKHPSLRGLQDSDDVEWPINGGVVAEPLLKGYIGAGGVIENDKATIFQNGTIMLTGHEDGHVLFWEMIPPGDRSSKGTIHLIHSVEASSLTTQESAIPNEVSSVAFCHASRTLVVGYGSGELGVFKFGRVSARDAPSPGDDAHDDSSQSASALPQKDTEGERTPSSSHLGFHLVFYSGHHSHPVTKIAFSSTYEYVAVADASGVVSIVNIGTKSFTVLDAEQAAVLSEDASNSVDSLLMSELVQVTDIPMASSPPDSATESKRSPGKRRTSRGENSIDGASLIQHRELIPVLFVGRGSGKLEMFHVQSAVKIGETLIDSHRSTSLSSVIMVDLAGKRVEIAGRDYVDEADKKQTQPSTDDRATGEEKIYEAELSIEAANTKQLFSEAIAEQQQTSSDRVVVEMKDVEPAVADEVLNDTSALWPRSNIIEVSVPAGSLGLHLYIDIDQHGVVQGVVEDNENAAILVSAGVEIGHVLTSINGLDVTAYNRKLICRVLEKLRDQEKVITFAKGFRHPIIDSIGNDEPKKPSNNAEQPRLLVCTCGRMIHLIPASLPRASEIALGTKEIMAQPLASVELRSPALVTSIVRVPVEGHIENCLAVADQSNRLYIISLLSLEIVWEVDGNAKLGNTLVDGLQCDFTYGGELVVANEFGEIERFSLLAEHTALEASMLERKCIKTALHIPERAYPFEKTASESPKKKGGIADAGKMFKKLVMSVKQDTDLKKVFQFATAEDERQQLFGDRAAANAAQAGATEDATGTAKVSQGMNATKDALMQAHQVGHSSCCVVACELIMPLILTTMCVC